MPNQSAPTASDCIVINWAGRPLAEWIIETHNSDNKRSSINFWASEDQCWAYFRRYIPLWQKEDFTDHLLMSPNESARFNVAYSEAGRILAKS